MEKFLENKSARKIMAISDTIATIIFVFLVIFGKFYTIEVEIPNEWRIQYGMVMAFYFNEKREDKKQAVNSEVKPIQQEEITDEVSPSSLS
jgi:hypothetical protein